MTRQTPRNIAASVRQRLLNKARGTVRPFNEILQYFAMERFLYRLSKSSHAEKFILKGALMLAVWRVSLSRSTMDIDMLGQTDNSVESIVAIVKDICRKEVTMDGLIFDAISVKGERITEDADYEGVRVRFRGNLDTARFTIQFDVGFGDVVIPSPVMTDYPTLLDLPAPRLRAYSKESTVAEKFEAMIKLGILNTRMKDFFDIWLLSRQFDFDGKTLAEAIVKTFSTRGTEIPSSPVPLSETFSSDATKATQWRGFIRKSRLSDTPQDFRQIVGEIAAFLRPIVEKLAAGRTFNDYWKASGPWKT